MPDTTVAVAIPAAPSPMPAPPPMPAPLHPMDPRRGENLSPMFCAFLCWLLDLQSMTTPAITGIAVSGSSVLAATTDDPLFNAHLGSLDDFERNLRGWGEACAAYPAMIDGLVAKLRRTGR